MPGGISTACDICGPQVLANRKECNHGWVFNAGALVFVMACHPMLVCQRTALRTAKEKQLVKIEEDTLSMRLTSGKKSLGAAAAFTLLEWRAS
jgi:hypothetical protein